MKKTLIGLAIIASALININSLQTQETVPATDGEATGAGGSSSYSVGQIT
ncbi:MAG: hypothetical protein HRT72_06400 [Flavobacteriales bacterium]|nr:hypothetical protein [Flavobacteriales bacterium]